MLGSLIIRREAQTIYYRSDSEEALLAVLYETFEIAVPAPRQVEIVNKLSVTG
jgi:hypothetical protein